ncbi:MAG: selenocysteine-specific translation elongation factor [Candidatus Zixiibacteriota bacterium]|nr:MAG: selenocysteine-specific translation elongation factor [candidate division Zixibacteria bacterium]
MFVVGTAGHIDHGKSALVQKMTGIDPDRLPEEKVRGMTIDLGFAWAILPSGRSIGIVDVPGHERFVKNMVAGVGGIDAVILVIAADDGWMPQTEEHFHIIELLEVKTGIVALTKKDLVDEEMIELQIDDIREHLKGSFLENSPIVPVSGITGDGLPDIMNSLDSVLTENIKRSDIDAARLFIDRRFTIQGMGTVVTGTLLEGRLSPDQNIEILPTGLKTRIRNLQTHKESIKQAEPGSRVAVNLVGVEKLEVSRGDAICKIGTVIPTDKIAAEISILEKSKFPLKSGFELSFMLGTTDVCGRVYLIETDVLKPGEKSFARIHLKSPLAAKIGDKFILRRISPQDTIGGGVVLDTEVIMGRKAKTKQLEVLEIRRNISPESIIQSEFIKSEKVSYEKLSKNIPFDKNDLDSALKKLSDNKKIMIVGDSIISTQFLEKYAGPAREILEKDHELRPWADGVEPGILAKKLKLKPEKLPDLIDFLVENNIAVSGRGCLRLPEHKAELKPEQQVLKGRLVARLSASPLAGPTRKDLIEEDPGYEVVLNFLRDRKEIIELKGGILLTEKDFNQIVIKVAAFLREAKKATASDIKGHLKSSRKYIIPLLEKLDQMAVTVRDGDYRKLKN